MLRFDAKIHVSLAAGRVLLHGLVVDEQARQEAASLRLPGSSVVLPCSRAPFLPCSGFLSTLCEHLEFAEFMDLDPARCFLYKTADRLYLSYRKVSAKKVKEDYEWTQEELGRLGETYDLPGRMVAVF